MKRNYIETEEYLIVNSNDGLRGYTNNVGGKECLDLDYRIEQYQDIKETLEEDKNRKKGNSKILKGLSLILMLLGLLDLLFYSNIEAFLFNENIVHLTSKIPFINNFGDFLAWICLFPSALGSFAGSVLQDAKVKKINEKLDVVKEFLKSLKIERAKVSANEPFLVQEKRLDVIDIRQELLNIQNILGEIKRYRDSRKNGLEVQEKLNLDGYSLEEQSIILELTKKS